MHEKRTIAIDLEGPGQLDAQLATTLLQIFSNPEVLRVLLRVSNRTISIEPDGSISRFSKHPKKERLGGHTFERRVRNEFGIPLRRLFIEKDKTSYFNSLSQELSQKKHSDFQTITSALCTVQLEKTVSFLISKHLLTKEQLIDLIMMYVSQVQNESQLDITFQSQLRYQLYSFSVESLQEKLLEFRIDMLSEHTTFLSFLSNILSTSQWNMFKLFLRVEHRYQEITAYQDTQRNEQLQRETEIQAFASIVSEMKTRDILESISWRLTPQEFVRVLMQYVNMVDHHGRLNRREIEEMSQEYLTHLRRELVVDLLYYQKQIQENNYLDFAEKLHNAIDPLTWQLVTEFIRPDPKNTATATVEIVRPVVLSPDMEKLRGRLETFADLITLEKLPTILMSLNFLLTQEEFFLVAEFSHTTQQSPTDLFQKVQDLYRSQINNLRRLKIQEIVNCEYLVKHKTNFIMFLFTLSQQTQNSLFKYFEHHLRVRSIKETQPSA